VKTAYPPEVEKYMKTMSRLMALQKLLDMTTDAILGEEPQTKRKLEQIKRSTLIEMRELNRELKNHEQVYRTV